MMYRHPMLDIFTGAVIAMGGPMAMMLPQRIFLEMLASGPMMLYTHTTSTDGPTPEGSGRTAV
jgi:hypothetical protein